MTAPLENQNHHERPLAAAAHATEIASKIIHEGNSGNRANSLSEARGAHNPGREDTNRLVEKGWLNGLQIEHDTDSRNKTRPPAGTEPLNNLGDHSEAAKMHNKIPAELKNHLEGLSPTVLRDTKNAFGNLKNLPNQFNNPEIAPKALPDLPFTDDGRSRHKIGGFYKDGDPRPDLGL